MKEVITTEKIPIKLWLDDMEEEALQQARNLANLPFAVSHISIMPDAHLGYGMPIGGVMATDRVIVPNAVGVDIACGVLAGKTSLRCFESKDVLKKIMGEIRHTVPVGFKKHKKVQFEYVSALPPCNPHTMKIVYKEYSNAMKSIGTLGGGNHFIEIQKGSDGFIWIMVHSGSRNLGLQVASHHNKVAQDLNKTFYSGVPKEWGLAFIPMDWEEGQAYLGEMEYCVAFARVNRQAIMDKVKEAFENNIDGIVFDTEINVPHNYARLEHHFGKNVMVHRKGATRAYEGELGIIPGSQGTSSYIVMGKGEPQSFKSCSHGAGRKMGRKNAQKSLDLEHEKKLLDDQGIIHGVRGTKDLDEAPSAYKDISVVMENQKDLVDIVVELKPLAVIKG